VPPETTATDGHGSASLLPTDQGGLVTLVTLFRALADPTRLRLVEYLREERAVTECVDQLALSQARVSTHLACLVSCGLVAVRRAGRHRRYRVTDSRGGELVKLAQSLSADAAAMLAACTRMKA
jgi:DNA-binding transcriptional ArsR family regulator